MDKNTQINTHTHTHTHTYTRFGFNLHCFTADCKHIRGYYYINVRTIRRHTGTP
jgi:hypothetical protein